MKRLIIMLLCVCVLLTSFCGSVSADEMVTAENQDGLQAAVALLKMIDVLDESVTLENVSFSRTITRLEFAEYLAKILKLSGGAENNRVFTDVPAESPVHDLYRMNVFLGDGEGNFNPGGIITVTDAVVALSRVLHYDIEAESKGGDPVLYIAFAKQNGMLDGVPISGELTVRDAIVFLYNSILCDMYDPILYTDHGIVYDMTLNSDKNILSTYYDIYYFRGRVKSNEYTSLRDSATVGEDMLQIDDSIYTCYINGADELIGQFAEGYYRFGKDDAIADIIYIQPCEYKQRILTVDPLKDEDIDKTISKIDPSAAIIYNGVARHDMTVQDCFEITQGTVIAIGPDGENYDLVIVEEHENVLVSYSDEQNENLYLTKGTSTIVIPYDDIKKVYMQGNMAEISKEDLAKGTLVSMFRSADQKYVKLVSCPTVISGMIKSHGREALEEIEINGNLYEIAPDMQGIRPEPGLNIEIKLDIKGRVGKCTYVSDSSEIVGFIYAMGKEGVFEDNYRVKLYNQNNEHLILKLANKLTVDGQRMTAEQASNILLARGTARNPVMELVKYKEKDGEITWIDIAAYAEDAREKENTLWRMAEYGQGPYGDNGQYYYIPTQKVFYPFYPVYTSTVYMQVPDKYSEIEEKCFAVNSSDRWFTNPNYGAGYHVELYKFRDEHPFADIVLRTVTTQYDTVREVTFTDIQKRDMKEVVIDNITMVVNEDGDAVYKLYGLRGMTAFYQTFVPDPQNLVSKLGTGDIINIAQNADGSIYGFEIIYDFSEDAVMVDGGSAPYPTWDEYYESNIPGSTYRYTFGILYDKSVERDGLDENSEAVSLFVISPSVDSEVYEYFAKRIAYQKLMIYDSDRRSKNAYMGSVDDILEAKAAGSECSRVFAKWRGKSVETYIIYR